MTWDHERELIRTWMDRGYDLRELATPETPVTMMRKAFVKAGDPAEYVWIWSDGRVETSGDVTPRTMLDEAVDRR